MKNSDPINDTLNVVAAADWITPLWAILQDLANGPVAHIGVAAGIFTRGDIRRILKYGGVESWGYIYNLAGDLIMFSVPQVQAAFANKVLQAAGVPVLYSPGDTTQKPAVTLANLVQAGEMRLVAGPSIWRLVGRFLKRMI